MKLRSKLLDPAWKRSPLADDRAVSNDERWFKRHPGRSRRLRPLFQREFGSPLNQVGLVHVCLVQPYAGFRQLVTTGATYESKEHREAAKKYCARFTTDQSISDAYRCPLEAGNAVIGDNP